MPADERHVPGATQAVRPGLPRLIEIPIAAVGLVLLSPVLLVAALAIVVTSPGPAVFRQERVGRGGRAFALYKLRSMRLDSDGPSLTARIDARVTPVGRWLRRTKLDELPQLWNVVRGDMALVGPRPEVPRYVAMYPAELRDKVLSVRPGITDPASIEFRDEGSLLARAADPERAYIEQVMPAKLRCAAQYVDHMSLMNDVRLIGATLRSLWAR